MALISCKECSAQISSKAVICPQCGLPLGTDDSSSQSDHVPEPDRAAQQTPDAPTVVEIQEAEPEQKTPEFTDSQDLDKPIAPRWVAVLLLILAIPAFTLNVIGGSVLLVGAFNVWTDMGKRSFFTGKTKRKDGWGNVGGAIVGSVLVLFVGYIGYSIYLETKIEEHLFGTWHVNMHWDADDFGPLGQVVPSMTFEFTEEFTISQSGTYSARGPIILRWEAEGKDFEMSFGSTTSGHWDLAADILELNPDQVDISNLEARIDGRRTNMNNRIVLITGSEPMTFNSFFESFAQGLDDPSQFTVSAIGSSYMVLELRSEDEQVLPEIRYTR